MASLDELPSTGPGSRSRRRWFLLGSMLVLIGLLVAAREVLLPFLLAIVLAYVLSPLVQWGERLTIAGVRPQRWVVVVTIYVLLLGGIAGLVTFSAPRLAAELGRLAREAPRIVAQRVAARSRPAHPRAEPALPRHAGGPARARPQAAARQRTTLG
jgi:predicted PurR-regulated permease PerM